MGKWKTIVLVERRSFNILWNFPSSCELSCMRKGEEEMEKAGSIHHDAQWRNEYNHFPFSLLVSGLPRVPHHKIVSLKEKKMKKCTVFKLLLRNVILKIQNYK